MWGGGDPGQVRDEREGQRGGMDRYDGGQKKREGRERGIGERIKGGREEWGKKERGLRDGPRKRMLKK